MLIDLLVYSFHAGVSPLEIRLCKFSRSWQLIQIVILAPIYFEVADAVHYSLGLSSLDLLLLGFKRLASFLFDVLRRPLDGPPFLFYVLRIFRLINQGLTPRCMSPFEAFVVLIHCGSLPAWTLPVPSPLSVRMLLPSVSFVILRTILRDDGLPCRFGPSGPICCGRVIFQLLAIFHHLILN